MTENPGHVLDPRLIEKMKCLWHEELIVHVIIDARKKTRDEAYVSAVLE